MAQETKSGGGNKLRRALRMLKEQTSPAGRASANGALQVAVVKATSHEECSPEEKYVEEILAAGSTSRSKVSFCTKELVTRLCTTQDWTVALKALILMHRAILDAGFLFQDQLTASFRYSRRPGKEEETAGRDSLKLLTLRDDDLSPRSREIRRWVRRYARYLDQRLICSSVVKSHFDSKWSSAHTSERVCYMPTEEVLADLLQLQTLLEDGCNCEVADEAGPVDGTNYNHRAKNPVIQGALILVVADSYKIQQEIGLRLREMLDRLDILQTSETLELVQIFKRSGYQTQSLLKFLEDCRELVSLLSNLPLPQTGFISEFEMKKLEDSLAAKKTSSSTSSSPPTLNIKPKLTISSSDGTLVATSISGPPQTKTGFQRTGSGYYRKPEPAHGGRQRICSQSMEQFPGLAETTSEEAPANQPAPDHQFLHINCDTLQNSQLDVQLVLELELSTGQLESSFSPISPEFNLIDFSPYPADVTSTSSRMSKGADEELSKDLISWVPLQQAASVSPSSPQAATKLAKWEQLLVNSLETMRTGSSKNKIDYSTTSTHQLNTIPLATAAASTASASMMNLQHTFYPSYIVPAAAAVAESRSFSSTSGDHMNHTEFLKLSPGSRQATVNAIAGRSGGVLEPIISTPSLRPNFQGHYYSGSSERCPIIITQHFQHHQPLGLQHLNHERLRHHVINISNINNFSS